MGQQVLVEPYQDKLGLVPDTEIAAMAGTTMWVVRGFRQKLGIPAHRGGRRRKATKKSAANTAARTRKASATATTTETAPSAAPTTTPAQARIAEVHDLVGVLPDPTVAKKAGVHPNSVRKYREDHGIPAAPRGRRRKEPVRKAKGFSKAKAASQTTTEVQSSVPPVPEPPKTTTSYAWKIEFTSGEERIAVDNDLVQVAQIAAEAGLGEVERIERIGVALA